MSRPSRGRGGAVEKVEESTAARERRATAGARLARKDRSLAFRSSGRAAGAGPLAERERIDPSRSVPAAEPPEPDRSVLVQLPVAGEILERREPEALQELLRRAVQERLARELRPPRDPDEPAIDQAPQHGAGLDAADRLDLGLRDRLAVGDDRQRLERRRADALRPGLGLQARDDAGEVGIRQDAPGSGDLAQDERERGGIEL